MRYATVPTRGNLRLCSFFHAVHIVRLPPRGKKKDRAGVDWGSIVIHFVGKK